MSREFESLPAGPLTSRFGLDADLEGMAHGVQTNMAASGSGAIVVCSQRDSSKHLMQVEPNPPNGTLAVGKPGQTELGGC